MHMPPPSAADTAKAVELGHEPSTVSVKGVGWFFIIFVAVAVFVHIAVWVVYRGLVKYQESQNVVNSAVTARKEIHPPEPMLQPTLQWHPYSEPEDLALMHGRENLEFVRRGWIDKETEEFRIPDDVVNTVASSGGAPVAPPSNPASGGTGAGMPR